MIKRFPSEEGEWETGCHGRESNNLALIASSWREHAERREKLLPRWQTAMKEIQRATLLSDKLELERASLGWLLANAEELYRDVCWAVARTAVGETDDETDDEAVDRTYRSLTEEDTETIRDWFCWLHRELVRDARENAITK